MKLIVGLGNPGEKYARNRHNAGFLALDRIAARHGFPAWRKRFQGLASEGMLDGERCLLLKPMTYMNESGRSVGEAVRFLKLPVADVIVIHDEIDLAPGKIKVKVGGGNAGNNGLRSISAHIDNDYQRVRIGIGHPGAKEAVQFYVLHDFTKAELVWLEPLLDAIAEAAPLLARGDAARFMNEIARAMRSEDTDAAAAGKPRRQKPVTGPGEPPSEPASSRRPEGQGEPQAKGGALAEKLKAWLRGGAGSKE
jgi:PTH1 family peptidyl-tRNA hydrolase